MNLCAALLVLIGIFSMQEVSFKPSNEFKAEVDFKFKAKPLSDIPSYDPNGNRIRPQTGTFQFFSVVISDIVANNGEVRIKAITSRNDVIISKKISPNSSYRIDMGFIDELKKGSVANEVTLYFLSNKKNEVNKIVLKVTKEGDFLVNGEKRGQF